MEQIYYTQCPLGYGLGASNGFQIKRLSEHYPLSGDFRHLGFRAFLPGSRTMAPPTLRYRRNEQGQAEVAWLTPRSHEYETERGLWGRPGGHFAHGILLDDDELRAIGDWPAGLFGRAFWTRSDPVPSRGEPPPCLDLSRTDLRSPASFETAASLAEGEEVETLARLLAAQAVATREGRTLFLIDAAERLADRIALLTLGMPAPWRAALTFSTYHDRPEELPGYRIQGTVPAARPNRMALLAQGLIADLRSGAWEPEVTPARWARTLAGWLVRGSKADHASWEATARRAVAAAPAGPVGAIWTEDWLDFLFGFDALTHAGRPPDDPEWWAGLAVTTEWAARVGLAGELLEIRRPAWWREAAGEGLERARAFEVHIGQADAWRGESEPVAWGEALARWFGSGEIHQRFGMLERALATAPPEARPDLVRALFASLPVHAAGPTLDWLKRQEACDRATLLPLEVPDAVAALRDRRDDGPLTLLLEQAAALPRGPATVLDALAAEAGGAAGAIAALARPLAVAFGSAGPRPTAVLVRWALRRGGDAGDWLRPYLRRLLADPTNRDAWRAVDLSVPSALRPNWVRVLLASAREPGLPDEAFRWGVEEVLLAMPEDERPHEPSWAPTYLDRMPSGLDLLARLYAKPFRALGVKAWLAKAHTLGELTPAQLDRIAGCHQYAKALGTGDARALLHVKLPDVPPEERGTLLAQMIGRLGNDGEEALGTVLDTIRDAWPGGFAPGAPGLDGLARALVRPLDPLAGDPRRWRDRLTKVLRRLGLDESAEAGFAPDGPAAAILAETVHRDGTGIDPWRLRQSLLADPAAWRALALDVRRELAGKDLASRLAALNRWDHALTKGVHAARFFEVWLNQCDGPTLAVCVADRAADLKSLGTLSWWESDRFPDARDDLRDAFARLAPMAPLPAGTLSRVRGWLAGSRRPEARPASPDLMPIDGEDAAPARSEGRIEETLSPRGLVRWECIKALVSFVALDPEATSCWQTVVAWRRALPLAALDHIDRARFVAWLIFRFERLEPYQVSELAQWLFDCGVRDVDRWAEDLDEIADVPAETRVARIPMVSDLRRELKEKLRVAQSSPRKAQAGGSPWV